MVARPAFFTDTRESQMDDLLRRVCEQLQLNPTQYEEAVQRYEAVSGWLEADGSAVASFMPAIFPQGSMRIGTSVKPIGRDEFDLDFVCECRVPQQTFESPLQLLNLIGGRLRENKAYRPILETKNRCIRLNYAREFHMDILPACPDESGKDGCLVVPDRESRWWKPSNPKGYANWFEGRCELVLAVMAERAKVLAKAEPIPPQEDPAEKATLKRAVQLLKRWRDVRYQRQPRLAPISMVLTTLAAHSYEGQLSVSEALTGILGRILTLIETSKPRIYVLNPANPLEDLSERWNNQAEYAAFVFGIRELAQQWKAILAANGIQNVSRLLESLFGDTVNIAMAEQARSLQAKREQVGLRVKPSGIITAAAAPGIVMRPNTFHGKR